MTGGLFDTSSVRFCQGNGLAIAFASVARATGFGLVIFQLVCPDPGEDIGTIWMRDGVTKHVLIEILIQLIPFGSFPEVEVVLQFEFMASHGDGGIVGERGGVVSTNLLHKAADLAELVKVELRDSGGDGGFGLDVSEGKYESLTTGGMGLGNDGDEMLEGARWLAINGTENRVAELALPAGNAAGGRTFLDVPEEQ